jgi:hypothetical protein
MSTTSPVTAPRCLNCGSDLPGPFCGQCGQRAIPAYPTLGELIGDTWQELSGYDGRVFRTFRHLVRRPGAMTVEVLEGHRARYVSPIRVYLVASVIYFLIAAASPNVIDPPAPVIPGSDVNIDMRNPEAAVGRLPSDQRAEILESVERAPWWMRSVLRSAVLDPAGFKQRVVQALPRTFFALVPVFAGIVALFYRRRRFSQHLIFALHVHAVIFLAQAAREAVEFTYSPIVVMAAAGCIAAYMVGYVLLAFRAVYRESWRRVLLKSAGIGTLYAAASLAAIVFTLAWAA